MTPLERRILDISYRNKLSHIGSCLTAVQIIDDIYSRKKQNERFILSCGHSHLAHAVVMEKYGIIKDAEENILKHGIHCERAGGCDVSTGSLGHGIGIALGMAMADRSKNVYCLISDGECAEGSVYEALCTTNDNEITNLKIYLTYNGYGAYRKIHHSRLFNVEIVDHRKHWFMKLYGQEAHYKVLTEKEYETLIR